MSGYHLGLPEYFPLFVWTFCVVIFLPVMGYPLYRALGCLLVIRSKWWAKALLLAGCAVLTASVIYLSDWGNIIPTFVFFVAAVVFSCYGSFLKRFTLSMMFSCIVFSSNALLDNWGEWRYLSSYHFVAVINIARLLFGLCIYLVIRKVALRKDFELSLPMWRLVLLLTILPVGLVFNMVLLADNHGEHMSFQELIMIFLVLLSFLGLLWVVVVLERQRQMEEERILYEMNRKYYISMEQQNEEIRRLRHDMNNHLQTALGLSGERREKYLKELLQNPQLVRRLKYCGDDTVNAVLSSKTAVMEQKGIAFQIRADISGELSMEKTDVCAIFGNALDNAIEALEKLPQNQRRLVLETRLGKGMLVLKIVNSCMEGEALPAWDGSFFTTKEDPMTHGFGMRSIKKAAEKYQGHVSAKTGSGEFELFVYCRCESRP